MTRARSYKLFSANRSDGQLWHNTKYGDALLTTSWQRSTRLLQHGSWISPSRSPDFEEGGTISSLVQPVQSESTRSWAVYPVYLPKFLDRLLPTRHITARKHPHEWRRFCTFGSNTGCLHTDHGSHYKTGETVSVDAHKGSVDDVPLTARYSRPHLQQALLVQVDVRLEHV